MTRSVAVTRKPSYPERLKRHLGSYRSSALSVHEEGIWSRNGRPYAHILPKDRREMNFLAPMRGEILHHLAAHPEVALHRDAHHLNSSQVMCINLMFPTLTSQPLSRAVTEAFGLPLTVSIERGAFEVVPDSLEATNFDFVAACNDGRTVYCEFKLTESDFGRAKDDDRHRLKHEQIYIGRLEKLVPRSMLEPKEFFANYQLLRNLSHLQRADDLLIVLVPEAHSRLASRARRFAGGLPPATRDRVRIVAMESLAKRLLHAAEDDVRARAHYNEFLAKYVIARDFSLPSVI